MHRNPPHTENSKGGDATRKWLTPAAAATYLGLAISTLARWRSTGGGPLFHRPSPRIVRYGKADLDQWMGRRRDSTSSL